MPIPVLLVARTPTAVPPQPPTANAPPHGITPIVPTTAWVSLMPRTPTSAAPQPPTAYVPGQDPAPSTPTTARLGARAKTPSPPAAKVSTLRPMASPPIQAWPRWSCSLLAPAPSSVSQTTEPSAAISRIDVPATHTPVTRSCLPSFNAWRFWFIWSEEITSPAWNANGRLTAAPQMVSVSAVTASSLKRSCHVDVSHTPWSQVAAPAGGGSPPQAPSAAASSSATTSRAIVRRTSLPIGSLLGRLECRPARGHRRCRPP